MKTFIIILIIIIGIVFLSFIIKKLMNNVKSDIETFKDELIKLGYQIKNDENRIGDLILIKGDEKYLIKFLKSERFAEVSINNKTTFEIKYGGNNDPGKPHPFHKFVNGMSTFMNYETTEFTKVVVVTPKPKKIVMWINENEIIFVKSDTKVYGSRIISINDLSLFKNVKDDDK